MAINLFFLSYLTNGEQHAKKTKRIGVGFSCDHAVATLRDSRECAAKSAPKGAA